jgi:hypothetical protein
MCTKYVHKYVQNMYIQNMYLHMYKICAYICTKYVHTYVPNMYIHVHKSVVFCTKSTTLLAGGFPRKQAPGNYL